MRSVSSLRHSTASAPDRAPDHVVGLEYLGHHLGAADPGQSRVCEHHRVELAVANASQPGVRVAPDGEADDVAAQRGELGGAARRPGADPRSGRQIRQLRPVASDQRVARVVPSRDGGERDSRCAPGEQVLQRVRGKSTSPRSRLSRSADEDPVPPIW
jgi:hypothetical protein